MLAIADGMNTPPPSTREIQCRWWPVFSVVQPGLRVAMHVDRDRKILRVRATGVRQQVAKSKTVTRAVSARELKRIVGSAARLTEQYRRILLGLMQSPE